MIDEAMNIDEYRDKVVQLMNDGMYLEDIASCVLYCSENGIECSESIDVELGLVNDNHD